MKRVLICTIMRDQEANMCRWLSLLSELALLHLKGQYEVEVSVYENDSTDGTDDWLRMLAARSGDVFVKGCPSILSSVMVSTEKLGTQRYGSVWSLDRLRNLANARQKCLDQVGDLSRFDKIAFIEPDVTYDPRWCSELILARHPLAAGLGEPDIYSGWSLRSESNPKESTFLYDTCATRATRDDLTWDISEDGGRWRAASLIPTNLGGNDSNCLHSVWSTFNGFCVYNARPFIEGIKWDWVNHRLDTGQGMVEGRDGHLAALEADTASLCETFRAHGHDQIYLNTNCLIRHV